MTDTGERCSPKSVKRLYLVDDEPLVLKALQRVLRQEGFEVRPFPGASEALSALDGDPPDCIISDYYMPRKDGLSFLEEVKRRHPQITRVLLTGGHLDDRVHKALSQEAIHILIQKPWNIEAIRKVMNHVVNCDTQVFIGQKKASAPCPVEAPAVGVASLLAGIHQSTTTVLVVDDDPLFLRMVEDGFSSGEYRVVVARSAIQAIETIHETTPDVLIVDLVMPDHNGFELMQALRDSVPSAAVVAITGVDDRNLVVEAYRQGANAFLHKPFELDTLEATIRRCIHLNSSLFNGHIGAELSTVMELQHAISEGIPIDQMLYLLLQMMIRYTHADTASIMLLEPDRQTLRIAASYGLDPEVVAREKVAVGERISGWVVKHNKPQLIVGQAPDDDRISGVPRREKATVGMCLPMLGRDQVLGALCVTRLRGDEPFTRDAIELGMLLGSEVARAIERTKEEEEERNLERNLMRRDKLVTIGELASGVAHEINNPLGYISSNMTSLKEYLNDLLPLLDLLAKAKTADDLPELLAKTSELDLNFILSDLPVCLKETMEGVDRVLKIVADLKMFARDDIEVKEVANINLVLDGAVNILWNQIKYKAQLVKEYSDIPLVPCYPSQLGQVFLNLLYNASQAIDKRGRIVLRSFQDGECVIVEVEDSGEGMEPEVLNRIFEPFFTTKPRGVGTGLGLSIARKIIRRHDGTLEATSIKGRGSLFRLRLPVAGEASNQ